MAAYRTEPDHEATGFPRGIPYIIGNEACERFSYYGMRAILFVYVAMLYRERGLAEAAADEAALEVFHTFTAVAYALPMVGAIVADRWLGKYTTIVVVSLVYCAGHACLALFDGDLHGSIVGLGLIAIGAGGIKPCVSAHVGDQFGRSNAHRLESVYQAFYFTINFGAFFSTILIPIVKESFGFAVAFALPGVLMGLATLVFWWGRHAFVHVPPTPGGKLGFVDALVGLVLFAAIALPIFGGSISDRYAASSWVVKGGIALVLVALGVLLVERRRPSSPDEGFLATMIAASAELFRSRTASYTEDERVHGRLFAPAVRRLGAARLEGPVAVLRILVVFAFVSVFWALFDQQSSSWVAQANEMDRVVAVGRWTFELMPEQIAAANPMLVMILVPFMGFVAYPFVERGLGVRLTPLRKMGTGMAIAALAFAIVAVSEERLDTGVSVSIGWQLLAYVVITIAEVMVSVTGLEFAYSEAPTSMKSTITGFWFLTVSVGNALVALFARLGGLPRATFFWSFAAMMLGAALLFAVFATKYRYRAARHGDAHRARA